MNSENNTKLSCPILFDEKDIITLAHGSGGLLTRELIEKIFLPAFNNPLLEKMHDGAVFEINESRLAITTDSFIVHPLFFNGWNIGDLAINGTVNDLAMCGAKPLYISAAFILEEGFPVFDLKRIVTSMQQAAANANVQVITGDTKVVEKGKGDGVFINTTGIGFVPKGRNISPMNCKVGDKVIISGSIAEHGMAVIAARDNLEFNPILKGDTAPLNKLTEEMFKTSERIHVLRDPTRGGLSGTLNEIAISSKCDINIEEDKIPISEQIKSACEIFGYDPLHFANEGILLAVCGNEDAEALLKVMKENPISINASIIGEISDNSRGRVIMKTTIGTSRLIEIPTGEQLPRIC